MGRMKYLSKDEQHLLSNLIRSTGRDPGQFQVSLEPDGFVRVVGPRGTACYPRENWFTRFSRHLDRAFFDAGLVAPQGPRFPRKTAAMPYTEAAARQDAASLSA